MINENILKSLFISSDGNNKAFVDLMSQINVGADTLKVISIALKRRDNENETFKLIKELYALCSNNPSIDADVQDLANALYESIGGADE